MSGGPFDLSDDDAYRRRRDEKLAAKPLGPQDLIVEIADVAETTAVERAALTAQLRRSGMAIYVETKPRPGRDDKQALTALGAAFGLHSLDRNHLADDDGITPLAVARDQPRARYIPYTERPIAWHTDGYYNPPERHVRSLLLHCACSASQGGENKLMDPELMYIALRDRDPALIRALMRPDSMTIPGNDDEGMVRPAVSGPVFYVRDGELCMRYTARTRSIEWNPDPDVQAAQSLIREILTADGPDVFTARLQPGWGLLCANVLHTRERFVDDPASPRLLYRARYHDKIRLDQN